MMLFSKGIFYVQLLQSSCLHKGQYSAKEVSKIPHCLQNAMIISNVGRRGLADMLDPSSSHNWLIIVFHLFWGGGYLMERAPKAVQKYLSWCLSSEMFTLQACECQSFPGGAGSGAGDVCRGCSAHEELLEAALCFKCDWSPQQNEQSLCSVRFCVCARGKLPQDNSLSKTK